MGRRDHVAFKNFAQLPAGHDVCNAAVFLHGAHDDFGNQLAVAADQKFAFRQHTLLITDVQHDKIPLWIHHNHVALKAGGERHDGIRPNEFIELIFQADDSSRKNPLLIIDGINGVLILFDQGKELEDFLWRFAGGLVGGEVGLLRIAILRGFGEFVGQIISALDLRGGDVLGLFAGSLRIGQLLLRVRQIGLRFGQIALRLGQCGLGLGQLGVVIIALGNKGVDMVAHLKNIQYASAQRRKNGHNQTNAHQHGLPKLYVHAPRVNASLQIVKQRPGRRTKRGLARRRIFCFHPGAMNQNLTRQLRSLLVLGRVSTLPTVWSNCLAGWWLGGGETVGKLPLLLVGASAIYTGGMFLNDAFDAESDRQRRPSRPIPSGAISLAAVWRWSFALLGLGAISLALLGKTTGVLTLALLASIIIYDAAHKAITASPWLLGLCRFWIYVIAGSTGASGLNGGPIWCGAALAFYVAGMDSVARRKSFRGPVPYWPLLLLAAPVFLAMLMNTGDARKNAMLVSLVFVLWVARCARSIFQSGEANVGRIVSGLLAGIVLVDWLAIAPLIPHATSSVVFLALFAATVALQRFVPEP